MSDAHLRKEALFDTQVVCPKCCINKFETYGLKEKKEGKMVERLYFICMSCGYMIKGDSVIEMLGTVKEGES